MQFATVAHALEEAHAAARAGNERAQAEVVRSLFVQAASADERERLLRVLLPAEDRDRVYGMKTPKLLQTLARALDKAGRHDVAAQLRRWVPVPRRGTLRKAPTVVCTPESDFAVLLLRAAPPAQQPATLADVCALCERLTAMYLGGGGDDARAEVLAELMQRGALDATTWPVFLRVLLKRVSMGVGLATVLSALDLPAPMAAYARQRSLRAIAQPAPSVELACGVPFMPMAAGHSLRAPYLFKWVFSREERLQHPLTPIDGRLVALFDRAPAVAREVWFAPLNANSKMRMVDIEEPRALEKASRRRHLLLLLAFKRARLLAAEHSEGLILHYTLSVEEQGRIVLLLRDATDARDAGVELAGEERLALPDAPPPAFVDLDRAAFLRTLLRKPSAQDPDASEIAHAAVGSRREGHRLQAVIAARPEVPTRRRLRAPPAPPQGVLVQTKLDGDRLQAHLVSETQVRLFTRNGYDVTELYSDVAEALRGKDLSPCILDGELVAVDAAGVPLPWDNAKWRFNGLFARPPQLEEGEGWMVEHGETQANSAPWETEDLNAEAHLLVTFVPPAHAGRWRDQGRALRPLPRGSHLRYIVFDVLMLQGEDLSGLSALYRWERLLTAPRAAFATTRFVGVLPESHRVRTAAELLRLLRESARQGTEGLILKDPAAPYAFGSTTVVQKVKLAGPDVNAGVVGVGFSLSTTPRRWGLATALVDGEGEDATRLVYYCRTDALEGDAMHRAFQIVYGLHSCVRVAQVLALAEGGECALAGGYRCVVRSRGADALRLAWHSGARVQGEVRFPLAVLGGDQQWLCSPWECPFALSLHGDLRPLEGGAPRHPVGRVELTAWQASPTWDSHLSVARKFEEAREQATCVEAHTLRRIRRLRALPPSRTHLVEIRRTVLGWLSQGQADDEGENWPQIPPAGFVTAQGFNHELRRLHAHLQPTPLPRALLDAALRDVDPQECLAIADLPPQSQWVRYDRARASQPQAPSLQGDEDDALQGVRAQDPAVRAQRIARLQQFKGEELAQGVVATPRFATLRTQPMDLAPLIAQPAPTLHDSDYIVLL